MYNRIKNLFLFILAAFFINQVVYCNIKLPKLVSNGMVLQRDVEIKICGWADSEEIVIINFLKNSYSTKTDSSGRWVINLPVLGAGGPYDMEILGNNKIIIRDILIGDVWIASGQSNMQTPILTFSDVGNGLVSKDGCKLKYFAVAGEDNNFVWANAEIKDDKVVVWNDKITNLVKVRYAWADNPDGANLYNKEGLPASPFCIEK